MLKNKDESERNWLTVREAAEKMDCTARYIQNAITQGKLSADRAEDGSYRIDKSEFYRAFPAAFAIEQKRIEKERIENAARTLLENEIAHLKTLISEKDKLNEFLKQQLDIHATEKGKLIDTLGSNQKLLENQSEKLKPKSKRWPFK